MALPRFLSLICQSLPNNHPCPRPRCSTALRTAVSLHHHRSNNYLHSLSHSFVSPSHPTQTLSEPCLALDAALSRSSVEPTTTDTKRRLNFSFSHFPWRRKQQQHPQQHPHIPTTFEPTSEPELRRDLTSRSPRRHTHAHEHAHTPTNTYPQTHPRPRARSRTTTERDRRTQIPSSTARVKHSSESRSANTPIPAAITSAPTPAPLPQPPPPERKKHSTPPFRHPPPLSVPSHQRQQSGMATTTTEQPDHQRDTKAGLRTWWQQFTTAQKPRPSAQHPHSYPHSHHPHSRSQTQGREYVPPPAGAVFGRPLKESLKYANVQISTADANGKLYVWGYIPVVVAKWCVYVILPSFFFLGSPLVPRIGADVV
jgi:hypothetical protein